MKQNLNSKHFEVCDLIEIVIKRREDKAFLVEGDIMVNGAKCFGKDNYIPDKKLHHFDYQKLKEKYKNTDFLKYKKRSERSSDFNQNYDSYRSGFRNRTINM